MEYRRNSFLARTQLTNKFNLFGKTILQDFECTNAEGFVNFVKYGSGLQSVITTGPYIYKTYLKKQNSETIIKKILVQLGSFINETMKKYEIEAIDCYIQCRLFCVEVKNSLKAAGKPSSWKRLIC